MNVLQRHTLFSLLLALFVAAPAFGQDAALEWRFTKDKPFYQTMTTTTTQNMTVTGTKVEQKQDQTFYFMWTPTKIDKEKNTVTLEQKIIGLKMNIDIGGSKITHDSTAPKEAAGAANNPLNKFFDALNNATFTITLDTKEMKVTNIEGHDKFVAKLTDANPSMKPLLEKILSKEALKDMAEPMFAALPGKTEKKGATWKRTSSLDMGPIGKYETTYNYTYEGPDKDKNEKIGVKTDLKYTKPENVAANLPFKITAATLEAKDSTGTVVYDPKAGWVKSSEMTMKLTGNLTIEISQQSTAVDLSQEQTTKTTTSAENPIKK